MNIVLDTNVVLVSISSKSLYHPIVQSLIRGDFNLFVTTEILNEYEEVLQRHMGYEVTTNFLEALLILPQAHLIQKYFSWNLISEDPDDNKFVDCAIAVNAKYLVTEDKHFKALEEIPFPRVEVIGIDTFLNILVQE